MVIKENPDFFRKSVSKQKYEILYGGL